MIADLLKRSTQAHHRARELRNKRDPQAADVLKTARDLRLQAAKEDPERKDPAWKEDRASHEEMLSFYEQMLGPVE